MKTTQSTSPLLVSVPDAAKLLGVSRRTIQNLIFNKTLVTKKIGTRTLIPYSYLIKIAAHGAVTNHVGQSGVATSLVHANV